MSILKNAGKIFTNFMKAILTALNVFSLFAIKEINSANRLRHLEHTYYILSNLCVTAEYLMYAGMHLFCNDL
jgi:hypothetical protein